MANTINGDNGSVSGTAGLKSSSDGTGILALQTNGTTAVTVDASQNVGIGTTTLNGRLNVLTATDSKLIFNDGSTTGNVRLEAVNNAYSAYKPFEINGSVQIFATGGTERMRIDSSGNLGIGTSSPNSKLTVGTASYGQAASVAQINGTSIATTNSGGILNIGSTDAAAADVGGSLGFTANGGINGYPLGQISGRRESATGSNYSSYLAFTTSNSGGTLAERMRIDSSGNVGINTSSPSTYKDSQGTIFVTGSSPNWATIQSRGDGPSGAGNYVSYGGSYSTNPINGARIGLGASGGSGQQGVILFYTKALDDNTTQPLERMRIGADGTVFVNTTTSVSAGKFIVAANSTTTNAIVIQDTSTSYGAGVYFQTFVNSTGNLAGYVAHTGSTTVNFGSVSDYRLKEDVAPVTNSLAKICQLKPVSYKWKEDGSFGEGFIAHELQEIIPLAVDGEKDAIGLDEKIKPQGVDPSKVVVHLVAAIQEQQALITAMTERITALEAK